MAAGPPSPRGPVTSLTAAIARMEAIDLATPPGDGLACFNRMYLEVTRTVGQDLGHGFFADPRFMTALDVKFANLYFAAADAALTRSRASFSSMAWPPRPRWPASCCSRPCEPLR